MALRTHTKNIISGDYERQIIDAMARAMFVTTWADRMEERGLGHKLSGQKLMDIAPKTSRDALAAAKKLAAMFAKANEGASMNDLYARALNVAGKRRGDTSPHSFGHYMAMEAMGHGVSWTDDHPEFKVNIPRFEYYPGRGAIKGMANGKARFDSIPQVGDTVTYYNAHNQKRSGRVVMLADVTDRHGRPGFVVNTGGRYGTPDVVFREQITSIRRGRGGAPALAAPHRKGGAGGYGYSKGMAYGSLSEQDLAKFKPAVERAKAKTHYKKIKHALDEGHAVSREDFAKAYEFESGRPYPHYKGRSKGKKPGCGCKGK